VIIVIIAIIVIITYMKQIAITLGVLTKRILQNILRNKMVVSLVLLFFRGDRGP
jgi:hypothetical protein